MGGTAAQPNIVRKTTANATGDERYASKIN